MINIPIEQTLLDNLGRIAYTLDRTYLSRLESDYGVLQFKDYYEQKHIDYLSNIRVLRVKRCVFDKEEKVADCFKNVLGLFANSDNSLAMVLHRSLNTTELFFVVKNAGAGQNEYSKQNIELLADSLRGNFPGTEVEVVEIFEKDNEGKDTKILFRFDEDNEDKDIKSLFRFDEATAITVLSNTPSEKSEAFISQGIEKLLNGIVPKEESGSYTVVLLMDAIPLEHLHRIQSGYEELVTAITPFAGYQFQVGENKTDTTGEMASLTKTEGVSQAISKTHSVNAGVSVKLTEGITVNAGYGYSYGKTDTTSSSDSATTGTNASVSLGSSEGTTYTYKSHMVSNLVSRLETVVKRIDESKSTGLWKYAAYVLSSDVKTTRNVADYLRSISQGDESHLAPSFTQSWMKKEGNGITNFGEIQKYIKHFCHPIFSNSADHTLVTPSIDTSTAELSNIIAFPRHSVQGLPVLECVRFGREPHGLTALNLNTKIGKPYHMRKVEENEKSHISLDKTELTKHTFITGSTGSGKSNAIYTLIDGLCYEKNENDIKHKPNDTKFLVIEPAKGEYKDVFGGRDGVTTYGTNPYVFPKQLQINPFSFPADIHVLEHIDRLVEVFNACWPMYAAMPAILREAVEKAYEHVNWNLRTSINPGQFPTFETLLAVLPGVIDSSGYSSDTSSDYNGALKTRVRSLTRGIHGQIFSGDIGDEALFNQNVIVDISRVGSSETKALIMGILVLKLQEFRMSEGNHNSKELRHITVLEEAHNLLRRTSSEQSQESSNLQGKSVEMLANAIAEMRTYGEGFIIADQSPGLMDMSVIRNTNTKIILRLPDEGDRMLVGKAAGLSDLQITELARLEVGVAAISQSDWLEPVLCKVDMFTDGPPAGNPSDGKQYQWVDTEGEALRQFLSEALKPTGSEHAELSQEVVDKVHKWCDELGLDNTTRSIVNMSLSRGKLTDMQQIYLITGLNKKALGKILKRDAVVSDVQKIFISQIGFLENDEIIQRINRLFELNVSENLLSVTVNKLETRESGVK